MKTSFLIFAAIVMIFACAVLVINPVYANLIYEENNLFENLTVAICGATLLLSLTLFFITYRRNSEYGFWLFLSVFVFIFIGDEISWGMAYFGLAKHKIAGVGFDGIHDILSIGIGTIKLTRDYIMSIGILDRRSIFIIIGCATAAIGLIYILVKSIIKSRERIYKFFYKNLKWKPFLFLILGLALIIIAMVIDEDDLIGFPRKRVIEESLEFLAATSFLFSCLSGFMESNRGRPKVKEQFK